MPRRTLPASKSDDDDKLSEISTFFAICRPTDNPLARPNGAIPLARHYGMKANNDRVLLFIKLIT